jgi:UDP-glucose 4-epimerase
MRVLVTGGAGFLGSHVVAALLAAGHAVTVLDNLSTGRRELVAADADFIRGDLRSERRLPEWIEGHDAVVHLAALVPVAESVRRPVAFAENNVVNTVRLLEAMRLAGVGRIVFSSSATVYGEPRRLPLREEDPLGVPANPYGASKLSAEAFIGAYARLHGFHAQVLRYFNPFGPNELCEPETHLVPNVVRAALERRPVPLYWRGEQQRDFIYVEDLAAAHAAVLELAGHNVFNIGSDTGTRAREVVQMVTDIVGYALTIEDLGERPGDVPASYASSEKLRRATGWRPRVGLREGLRRTVEYYGSRLEGASAGA